MLDIGRTPQPSSFTGPAVQRLSFWQSCRLWRSFAGLKQKTAVVESPYVRVCSPRILAAVSRSLIATTAGPRLA